MLSLTGPIIVVANLLAWIGLVLTGWIFLSGGDAALIDARNPPVTWPGRIWYVGYAMFTVGNGDFTPDGSVWRIASTLVAGSGFVIATIAVSYVLAVVAAASEKRALASSTADDLPPDLDDLRQRDIPTVSDEEFEEVLSEMKDRRKKRLGIVRADAWDWSSTEQ